MRPSRTEREISIEALAGAIGRLQHVHLQLEQTRRLTTENGEALLSRIAHDEFCTYKHHFNNGIAAINSLLEDLSPDVALHDQDAMLILQDTLHDLRSRVIDDVNAEPMRDTGLRGFAATAAPLAQEIASKMRYLKDDDAANAREMIGELQGIPELANALETALENTISAIKRVPNASVTADEQMLHERVHRGNVNEVS